MEGVREIIDLDPKDRHRLMNEISSLSVTMRSVYAPDKLNVAALGNQVPQLHVHVIARFEKDAAWPNPVWGKGAELYANAGPVITQLQAALRT
jgi:diadenosine tetraphosphate (Ap4A) HIT family hydrolase